MRGERNREAEKMGREDAVGHATHIKTPFQVMHIGFYPREGRCRVPGMTMALIWMFSIVRDKSDELFRDDRLVGAAGTAVGSQGGMLLIDFGDGEDAVALGYCRQLKQALGMSRRRATKLRTGETKTARARTPHGLRN